MKNKKLNKKRKAVEIVQMSRDTINYIVAEKSSLGMWCADVSFVKNGKTAYHELVFVNVADDMLYIFEPTSSNGWHSGESMSEPLAIQEYEQTFGYSQFTVLKLFNGNSYKEFNSNQAFFDWF